MQLKVVKLMSGEEIFGEVVEESDTDITIKNPLAIMLGRAPNGDVQVGFVPFAMYLGREPRVTFKINNLVMINEVVDERMVNQYNSAFGGIVTPPKQLIVG